MDTCTESTRTIDPETGNGFDDRGKFQVTAFTVSCATSASSRTTEASENVVVSCTTTRSECDRAVSTGGVAVLKMRVNVSFELRCTAPLQLTVSLPWMRVPLRLPLNDTWVMIFRTDDIGLHPATTAPFASRQVRFPGVAATS